MNGQRGFTLIEALAAFTILAIAAGATFGAFSTGLTGASRAAQVLEATAQARSLMAEIGVARPLTPGRAEIALTDGRAALIDIALARPASAAGVAAWSVSVEVGDGRGPPDARLETVKLGPAP